MILAESDGWSLAYRYSVHGWHSLKLTHPVGFKAGGRIHKRNWWLAWNGLAFAYSRDASLLRQWHPDVEAWLRSTLLAFQLPFQLPSSDLPALPADPCSRPVSWCVFQHPILDRALENHTRLISPASELEAELEAGNRNSP